MITPHRRFLFCLAVSALLVTVSGCGRISQQDSQAKTEHDSAQTPTLGESTATIADLDAASGIANIAENKEPADPFQASLQALKPFHALIGTWQGVTVRAIGGAKAIENPQWNWDFLTDRERPALVVTSKSSPYVRLARLTYLPERHIYQLLLTSPNGSQKVFEGTINESALPKITAKNVIAKPLEKAMEQGEVDHETTIVLSLQKVVPEGDPETVSIRLNGNDRYELEIFRLMTAESTEPEQSGGIVQAGGFGGQVIQQTSGQLEKTLQRYDTVQMKREGAANSASAGAQPCIVSGGQGTLALTFEGKTFHVCCEGCKNAFMADPLRWTTATSTQPER